MERCLADQAVVDAVKDWLIAFIAAVCLLSAAMVVAYLAVAMLR